MIDYLTRFSTSQRSKNASNGQRAKLGTEARAEVEDTSTRGQDDESRSREGIDCEFGDSHNITDIETTELEAALFSASIPE